MMLYQVVKLFGVWGMEVYYSEEGLKASSNKCMVGWAWTAVEIGNFGKRRGVTVEICNLGKDGSLEIGNL
jgi:hypothetical protein